MAYSARNCAELDRRRRNTVAALMKLHERAVLASVRFPETSRVREHLANGVGRRTARLGHCIDSIYEAFPPSTTKHLSAPLRLGVEANLHAFLINVAGVLDNWAWAYVYRHQLDASLRPVDVGLFLVRTRQRLPGPLQSLLGSTVLQEWLALYGKQFRDSLAHRIPVYLPPATMTPEDVNRFHALWKEQGEAVGDDDRFWSITRELEQVGSPSFHVTHSFLEQPPPPLIQLHPQLLADAQLVVRIGARFLRHLDDPPSQPSSRLPRLGCLPSVWINRHSR